MSQRIQIKRSSVLGKRPSASYLEPGELALNSNASDPGLFFETNDGRVAKIGPVYIGADEPVSNIEYGHGEQWLDTTTLTIKTFNALTNEWVKAISPALGGASTVMFVGSSYPESSDDIDNDGSSRPYKSLSRALLEVARRSIATGRADDVFDARTTIFLLPGDTTVYNEPGLPLSTFEAEIPVFSKDTILDQALLSKFNPEEGGCLLPRGVSIVGMDRMKSALRPTYYPKWTLQSYNDNATGLAARTSTLKWTGNSYITELTFRDKPSEVSVTKIEGAPTAVAVLTSLEPHGFKRITTTTASPFEVLDGDKISLTYPKTVSQSYDGDPVVLETEYYVEPLDAKRFLLRALDGTVILRNQLPEFAGSNTDPTEFLRCEYYNTTHHRLSAVGYATAGELNIFYSKVQRAFSNLDFGGTVNNAEVTSAEVNIVAALPQIADSIVNRTENQSPSIRNVQLRSDWGMCGLKADGSAVGGFKTAFIENFEVINYQNDADCFEVYRETSWYSLKQAYATSRSIPLSEVTNFDAINYLVAEVSVNNFRYFYRQELISDTLSNGLTADVSDCRHYGVKSLNGAIVQGDALTLVGPAIGVWAASGGRVLCSDGTSVYGSQALHAEGFTGINTQGGALPADKDFVVAGVYRPAAVTRAQVIDEKNHQHIYFPGNIVSNTAGYIDLDQPVNLADFHPYTLKPGSAIWVEDIADGTTYKANLVSTGDILSPGKTRIYLEEDGNTINGQPLANLGTPYIRRFVDPRPAEQRNYQLHLSNTNVNHRAPQRNMVLRYAEQPQPGFSALLTIGKQLDPGQTGGWNHLFIVDSVKTSQEALSPNVRQGPTISTERANDYFVTLRLGDSSAPYMSQYGNTGHVVYPPYAKGTHATKMDRGYQATFNDINLVGTRATPTDEQGVWQESRVLQLCTQTESAYVDTNYPNAEDPLMNDYPDDSTYMRGIGVDPSNYALEKFIDADDGSATFGIVESDSNYVTPSIIDPDYSHSKQAMTRFLSLLGFASADIATTLTPQRQGSRHINSAIIPGELANGYALAKGTWPVEFNVPSSIVAVGHGWEHAGLYAPGKGLSVYQKGDLQQRQAMDFIVASSWGGTATAAGTMENGVNVVSGGFILADTGEAFLASAE